MNRINTICKHQINDWYKNFKLTFFLLLLFFTNSQLFAQPAKTTELPKFELSALQIGSFQVSNLYWIDVVFDKEGKQVKTFQPLNVSNGSRGPTAQVPLVPPVKLYTGSFDQNGVPQMKPFLDIPVKSAKDRLLLVFHQNAKGEVQQSFLDDSEKAHPAGSVRFVNFSSDPLAFSVGGAALRVSPGGGVNAIPVANAEGQYPLKYYVQTLGNSTYQAPTKLLRMLRPNQRLLVLYAVLEEKVTSQDPGREDQLNTKILYQPVAYRLYDKL